MKHRGGAVRPGRVVGKARLALQEACCMSRQYAIGTVAAGRLVDLVVGAQMHQERLVTFPAKEDAEIVVDTERPIGIELAFELVGVEEWVLWIGGEAAQCRPQH